MQLLQDASNKRLDVHYGDALKFNMEQACGAYVTRVNWEDGESNVLSDSYKLCFLNLQLQISMW